MRLLVAILAFVWAFEGAPRLWSASVTAGTLWGGETTPSASFLDAWDDVVFSSERERGAHLQGRSVLHHALGATRSYLALPRDERVLDEAAEAAIRQDHLRAASLAARVLEVPQPAHTQVRAHDIAAVASLALDDAGAAHAHAVAALELAGEAEESADVAQDWRYARAMHAAWANGDADQTMTLADEVLERLQERRVWHEARFLAAWSRMQRTETRADGVRRAERLLTLYPEYPDVDALTFAIADAERALGRERAAAQRLDAWIWDHAFHPWRAQAEEARLALDAPAPSRSVSDERDRGRALRRSRHWDAAREVLAGALERCDRERVATATCNEIRLQIVLNEYESADFHAALEMLDALDATGAAGVSQRERSKWRSRSLSRIGAMDEGYEVLAAFYRTQPERRRDLALGEYAADAGDYARAYEHYARAWSDAEWASFHGAFLAYLSQRYPEADTRFEALASRTRGRERAGALYWRGRTLARQGRVEEARAIWENVSAEYPTRYYGLQSRNRLRDWDDAVDGVPARRPGRIHWTGPEGPPRASLSDVQASATAPLFEPYAPELDHEGAVSAFARGWGELFPGALEAAALLRVGDHARAREVLREVLVECWALEELFADGRRPSMRRPIRLDVRAWSHRVDTRSDKRGWWGVELGDRVYGDPVGRSATRAHVERHEAILAEREAIRVAARAAAREMGDHYMVRRMVFDQETFSNLYTEGADRTPWLEAYPHAYAYEAQPSLERYDLNPYLLWSLMIVESDLNPDTVSFADAYGLLQVIPKTGEKIAMGFGEPDFGIHDLMEPSAAFRFGAWYFAELLTKFHGQEMLAMVAYNAGPHQVQRWLDWRGEGLDLDEFIETVPYVGARRYPQTILRYVLTYRLTYAEGTEVYVGNALDPTYEDNIYY